MSLSFWQDVPAQHSWHSTHRQLGWHGIWPRMDLVESDLLQCCLSDTECLQQCWPESTTVRDGTIYCYSDICSKLIVLFVEMHKLSCNQLRIYMHILFFRWRPEVDLRGVQGTPPGGLLPSILYKSKPVNSCSLASTINPNLNEVTKYIPVLDQPRLDSLRNSLSPLQLVIMSKLMKFGPYSVK